MCLFDNLLRVKSHLSVLWKFPVFFHKIASFRPSGKMTKKIVCNLNQHF